MRGKDVDHGKVLLVEDSPTRARQVGRLLESNGFDMEGYTVCRRLRKESSYYVPVLMVTQRKEVEDRIDGLEVGPDDYLPRPFDERELLARIKALMRTKRVQDGLNRRLENEQRDYKALCGTAIADPLTGLYNRHHFPSMLHHEFETVLHYGTPLACIMVDIDHCRTSNNRYGHLMGDQALQNLAGLLRSSVRRLDIMARYGGEESVLLLPLTNTASAAETAERPRQGVETTGWESPAGPLKITVSPGVAAPPEVAVETAGEPGNREEQALLRGKAKGRNRAEKWTEKVGEENP